jgi:hypothetical protein
MQGTLEVGKKIVELCKQGKMLEAIETLYDPNIISFEPFSPTGQTRMEGLAAVKGKNDWWVKNHEVHKCEVTGPWPHCDRFIAIFDMEVTAKTGPMQGKRFPMVEAALYTVKNGKIVHEEFFYHMGG